MLFVRTRTAPSTAGQWVLYGTNLFSPQITQNDTDYVVLNLGVRFGQNKVRINTLIKGSWGTQYSSAMGLEADVPFSLGVEVGVTHYKVYINGVLVNSDLVIDRSGECKCYFDPSICFANISGLPAACRSRTIKAEDFPVFLKVTFLGVDYSTATQLMFVEVSESSVVWSDNYVEYALPLGKLCRTKGGTASLPLPLSFSRFPLPHTTHHHKYIIHFHRYTPLVKSKI